MQHRDGLGTQDLSIWTKISYGSGHVLNDLVASCWFSYTLIFLNKIIGLTSVDAGLLLLIGQFADGFATPCVGYLSDRTSTKYGKRRTWILMGSIGVAFSFPAIFHPTLFNWIDRKYLVLYYAVFIILLQFSWASTQVSHLALVPELTPVPTERVLLNSIRFFATITSSVVVYVLTWVLLSETNNSTLSYQDAEKFEILSFTVVGIGLFFALVFACGIREAPSLAQTNHKRVEWYHWFSRRRLYETGAVYVTVRLLNNLSQTYMPLFLVVTLQAPKASIANIPFTVFAFGLLSTSLCQWITKQIGTKGLGIVGCIIVLGSSLGFYFVTEGAWHTIYGIAAALGFGVGMTGVAGLSLIAELVSNSVESGAFVYGAIGFFDKLTNGIAIFLCQCLAPIHEDEKKEYYRHILIYVPSVSAISALLILFQMLSNNNQQNVVSNSDLEIAPTENTPLRNGKHERYD